MFKGRLMAKILVVDDNAVIREVLTFSLHNHYDVTVAENGKEGIAVAEASQFDLIITDIKMPEMDGIEFVTEMRKKKAYAQTPILVITANLKVNEQEIRKSGATGWIVKPFEPIKLLETITNVLK